MAESVDVVFGTPEGRPLDQHLPGWETVTLPTTSRSDTAYERCRRRLGRAHFWVASKTVAESLTALYQRHASWRSRLYVFANYGVRARVESNEHFYSRLVRMERERWWRLNGDSEVAARQLLSGFDAVLFPMPHSAREWWTARYANRLGLKTIAMIHSFDNPTTTFRHPIRYDAYLVWNARMARELTRIYPEVDPSSIHITGTPHFQFHYASSSTGSREELAAVYGLDPERPILLYAGGPHALVPHEAALVARFYQDLQNWPTAARPQIIIRPHPIEPQLQHWDSLRECSGIRWSIPWRSSDQEREWVIPSARDIRDLCVLVRNVDVVINSCSTMSIDAAVCDTPVICLDYALPPFADFAAYVHRYYDWDHYKPLIESGGVRLATNSEELVHLVRRYIADRSLDRDQRARLVADICGPCPSHSVATVAGAVAKVIGLEAEAPQPVL